MKLSVEILKRRRRVFRDGPRSYEWEEVYLAVVLTPEAPDYLDHRDYQRCLSEASRVFSGLSEAWRMLIPSTENYCLFDFVPNHTVSVENAVKLLKQTVDATMKLMDEDAERLGLSPSTELKFKYTEQFNFVQRPVFAVYYWCAPEICLNRLRVRYYNRRVRKTEVKPWMKKIGDSVYRMGKCIVDTDGKSLALDIGRQKVRKLFKGFHSGEKRHRKDK